MVALYISNKNTIIAKEWQFTKNYLRNSFSNQWCIEIFKSFNWILKSRRKAQIQFESCFLTAFKEWIVQNIYIFDCEWSLKVDHLKILGINSHIKFHTFLCGHEIFTFPDFSACSIIILSIIFCLVSFIKSQKSTVLSIISMNFFGANGLEKENLICI